MQFIKVRDVKSPVRDVNENAGIDFYIPENTEDFRRSLLAKNQTMFEANTNIFKFNTIAARNKKRNVLLKNGNIYIAPHAAVLIPSGIKAKFEPNIALIANNKSGVATKKNLIFGASVVDASYHGEIHLHVINISDTWQMIECGTKLIQFIPHIISMDPVEILGVTEEEFYKDTVSKRGELGFGEGTGLN